MPYDGNDVDQSPTNPDEPVVLDQRVGGDARHLEIERPPGQRGDEVRTKERRQYANPKGKALSSAREPKGHQSRNHT